MRRFVPSALPAVAAGAWLLTLFEPAYVEFLLGCFLLLTLVALLRRPGEWQAHEALPLGMLPFLGAAAGLLSGFTGPWALFSIAPTIAWGCPRTRSWRHAP